MASKCASKTLFVGNLHASLEENDLLEIFRPFGRIVECCKRWCHYGFIQFATEEEAKLAFNNLNGSKVRGRPMRIEFQRKKLRNIQALLEAEAEAKLHLTSTKPIDQLSYFNLTNNENLNPLMSLPSIGLSSSNGSVKDEDEDMMESAEIEKCLLKVFDEILVEDNNNIKFSSSKTSKKESDVLKTITNFDNNNKSRDSNNNTKNDLKMLENLCYNSLSSSCSSPLSQNDDISPKSRKNSSSSSTKIRSTSVRLFRSINSSNTIYVQPTDIIIPLSEGDYNEYKLFPMSDKQDSIVPASYKDPQNVINKILNNLGSFNKKKDLTRATFYTSNEDDLELYSPPISSVSSVSSCSNSSSLASSPCFNSPIQKQKYL